MKYTTYLPVYECLQDKHHFNKNEFSSCIDIKMMSRCECRKFTYGEYFKRIKEYFKEEE